MEFGKCNTFFEYYQSIFMFNNIITNITDLELLVEDPEVAVALVDAPLPLMVRYADDILLWW